MTVSMTQEIQNNGMAHVSKAPQSPGVPRLLIVDDERAFLRGLSACLEARDEASVVTAINGAEAVEILATNSVDLVVTDLQMPVMDGFALLTRMSVDYPTIPVMVMTAHATPTAFERMNQLGIVTCLEKPIDIERFCESVRYVLSRQARGFLQGISVTSILQLLEMERKTATLRITCGERTGEMFFKEGQLINAVTSAAIGDRAAMEIISWEAANVQIDPDRCSPTKTVTAELNFLIMEALRCKDEGLAPEPTPDWQSFSPEPDVAGRNQGVVDTLFTPIPSPCVPTEEQADALSAILGTLDDIEGSFAVAVTSSDGRVLARTSTAEIEGLDKIATAFNAVASAAQEVAMNVGSDACNEVILATKKHLVLVHGPDESGEVPFRVVALLARDCDQGAFAHRLREIVPQITKAFNVTS